MLQTVRRLKRLCLHLDMPAEADACDAAARNLYALLSRCKSDGKRHLWPSREDEKDGGARYIWHTQGDDKVRGSHAANNGSVFAFKKPPITGHPGEDYGCRCWAEPLEPV